MLLFNFNDYDQILNVERKITRLTMLFVYVTLVDMKASSRAVAKPKGYYMIILNVCHFRNNHKI